MTTCIAPSVPHLSLPSCHCSGLAPRRRSVRHRPRGSSTTAIGSPACLIEGSIVIAPLVLFDTRNPTQMAAPPSFTLAVEDGKAAAGLLIADLALAGRGLDLGTRT